MGLRHALLGLLSEDRASGYDLTRRFERMPWRLAWHAEHSQIYPELTRMVDDGLIMLAARGARRRRVYTITQVGLDELRRWLLNPPATFVVRSESALRLLLLPSLEAGEARAALAAVAAARSEGLTLLRDAGASAAATKPGDTRALCEGMATELSCRWLEAERDWALWALERFAAAESSR
jgi:DNA-binding PadR family transcriptional regulator